MKQSTWEALDSMYSESPNLAAGGVAYERIDQSSTDAGFSLDSDYRDFVHKYGGAVVGQFSIFGLGASKLMGRDMSNVFEITKRFREQGWSGVENWLVISMDHAGNPVGLDSKGEVWISDAVHGCVDKLAGDLEEYILDWCLDGSG